PHHPTETKYEMVPTFTSQKTFYNEYVNLWKNVITWPTLTDPAADHGSYKTNRDLFETYIQEINNRSNGSANQSHGEEYDTTSMLMKSGHFRAALFDGLSWLARHPSHIKGYHFFAQAADASGRIYKFLNDEIAKETGVGSGVLHADAWLRHYDLDNRGYGMNVNHHSLKDFTKLALGLKATFSDAASVAPGTLASRSSFFGPWLDNVLEIIRDNNPNIVTAEYFTQVLRNFTETGTNDINDGWIEQDNGLTGADLRYPNAEKIATLFEYIATRPGLMSKIGEAVNLHSQESLEAQRGVLRLANNFKTQFETGGRWTTRLHFMLVFLALGGSENLNYRTSTTSGNVETNDDATTTGTKRLISHEHWSADILNTYKIGESWVNVPTGTSVPNMEQETTATNWDAVY
ncbi:MAG: hypothetical protein PVJ92_01255, partial [Candidatus Dependentiae bacterium]